MSMAKTSNLVGRQKFEWVEWKSTDFTDARCLGLYSASKYFLKFWKPWHRVHRYISDPILWIWSIIFIPAIFFYFSKFLILFFSKNFQSFHHIFSKLPEILKQKICCFFKLSHNLRLSRNLRRSFFFHSLNFWKSFSK